MRRTLVRAVSLFSSWLAYSVLSNDKLQIPEPGVDEAGPIGLEEDVVAVVDLETIWARAEWLSLSKK